LKIPIPSLRARQARGESKPLFAGVDEVVIGFTVKDGAPIFSLAKRESAQLEKILNLSLPELFATFSRHLDISEGVKAGEVISVPLTKIDSFKKKRKILAITFLALGEKSVNELRRAGAALGRKYKGKKSSLLIFAPGEPPFIDSLLISNYGWSQKSLSAKPSAPAFILVGADQKIIDEREIVARHLWRARDLVHTTANQKTPAWVANQISQAAKRFKSVKVEIKSGAALKEFGGLLAVGGSSKVHPPRFVQVTYTPKARRGLQKLTKHVVLVGKGITFDTGGVSMKRPYDMMVAMKTDMSGAAVVGSVALAAAELELPVKVTALLMLAENTVSATAQRPSDVITHYGGTTVEVINTDAEGRLVLADGLAYADQHLNPDYLIDVATLTGAASLGLGKQYAAMYTRDAKLAKKLHEISEWAGDRFWHMPLIDDYQIALESNIADYNHTADKEKFSAGSVTAALFLEKFVGKRRWVHLDIAGPARSEVDAGEYVKGGTAFGLRTLTAWLASL
jgi:leucyl aminopeptidase